MDEPVSDAPPAPQYEFDDVQNSAFMPLARVLTFVGITMAGAGGLVAIPAALVIWLSLWAGSVTQPFDSPIVAAILGVPAAALMVAGIGLSKAAGQFRDLAATRGHDIDHLMDAFSNLADAYRRQRWLWIAVVLSVLLGLTNVR